MKYFFIAAIVFFGAFVAAEAAPTRDDELLQFLERVLKEELENTIQKVSRKEILIEL